MSNLNAQTLYAIFLTALCCWREARNQTAKARLGVIWTINNRAAVSSWWNNHSVYDPVAVILQPKQYSSFNEGDPNATKFPASTDSVFQDIKLMAISPGQDPTGGATHYIDRSLWDNPPEWASQMTHTCDIDSLRFFK